MFENNILNLTSIMIPPLSSNTMSGNAVPNPSGAGSSGKKEQADTEEKEGGRPEKPDNEKSDKTIANRESM